MVGQGEVALLRILEQAPQQKILYGSRLPPPEMVPLQPVLPWSPNRPIPIARGTSHCSWNRCRFCHHAPDDGLPRLPVEEIGHRIKRYYREYGWRVFHLYDNHTAPEDLEFLLRYCERESIPAVFDVFGMRLLPAALDLRDVLQNIRLVRSIGWGLELYDQEELKRYRKGIHLKWILPILEMAHGAGILSAVFILLGLPACSTRAYEETCRFVARHSEAGGILYRVLISWFLFSDALSGRFDGEDFGVQPGSRYMLHEYFGNRSELAGVGTIFRRFESAEGTGGTALSRDQVFLRHREIFRRLLSLPAASYDYRGFFLQPETWQRLWGTEYSAWLRRHPPAVRRAARASVVDRLQQMTKAGNGP